MERKITIRDIAKKTGYSVATISRALDPHLAKFVRLETREKILKIIKKTGYRPNPVAKQLATGKSSNIAIFIGTRYASLFYSDYYMKLLSGAMEAIENTSYNLIVRMVKLKEWRVDLDEIIEEMDIAGCIVCDFLDVLQVSIASIDNVKVPVVILNRNEKKDGVGFVVCDNFKAAYEATRYLINLGHRKIAIVRGDYLEKDALDRVEGYRKALSDHGIPENEAHIFKGDFSQGSGMKAVEELLSLKDKPTAIFCANDEMAIGAFMKLRELGVRCPQEISLMGFDGIDAGKYLLPPLASIRQPIDEMGKEAVGQIVRSLEDKTYKRGLVVFDAPLLEGGTCGPVADRT